MQEEPTGIGRRVECRTKEGKVLCAGTLRQWGTDHEELGDGVGIFPVGIIEQADGQVRVVYAGLIRFADKGEEGCNGWTTSIRK